MRLLRFLSVLALGWMAAAAWGQSATTTMLAVTSGGSSVTSVKEGTEVTLTATVAAGSSPVSPGQVNFCEVKAAPLKCTDIRLLGTVQLSSAGQAVFNFYPGPGTHTYQAVFVGTHLAAGSSAQATLAVSPFYPTATTIAASGSPGNYTLTATVTGTEGTVPPTGTVSFLDTGNSNYVLASAPLVPASGIPGVSFVNPSNPVTPEKSVALRVADFNGDGKLDLLVIEVNSLSVYLGHGDGTFSLAPTSPSLGTISLNPGGAAVADFNGDGKPDIALALTPSQIPDSGKFQVALGNGDGTFTAGQLTQSLGAFQVYTGDFDGDGNADLAILNGSEISQPPIDSVSVFLGNGDGTFTFKSITPAGNYPLAAAVGDYNGDGKADLAVLDLNTSTITILLGNGDGTFTPGPQTPATGVTPVALVAADFNQDGILDLAVANSGMSPTGVGVPGTVSILLGNGDGTFRTAPNAVTGGPGVGIGPQNPETIAVGDFNGDGKADLVISDQTNLWVALGNGDGTFAPVLTQSVYSVSANTLVSIYGISTGDWNGDGLSDIAAIDQPDLTVDILLSNSGPQSATATANGVSVVGTGTHLAEASYPGDSDYQPSISGTVPLVAEPEPTTLTVTANPATSFYSQQVVLTAAITPNTAQDHNPTGTVTFSAGSTVLGAESVAGGIATLDVTSLPPGIDAVTAAYSGDTNFAPSSGSATETVSGYGSTTALIAAPDPAGAGQTVTLTATVNGVGYSAVPTGMISFYDGTNLLGQGTLSATGQATYTTAALALGTHSLTAVYPGSAPYATSTSAPFSEIIVKPDFAITLSSPSVTLQTYQHTTTTVTLTSVGEFSDSLSLTCGAAPAYVTCKFTPTPAALSANGTATVQFYLDTDSIVGGDVKRGGGHAAMRSALAFLFPSFGLLVALRGRTRRRLSLLLAVSLASLPLFLGGCGSSIIAPVPSAAPGTYTIPIVATGASTGLTHTASLALTVTP